MTSLKVNGLSVTNPSELSDKFNNHFATIGSKLASKIDSSDTDSHLRYLTGTDKRFELRPTSTTKVFSLLNKLNKSKATELDKISGRLLPECADLISSPFAIFSINQLVKVYFQMTGNQLDSPRSLSKAIEMTLITIVRFL